MSSWNFGGYFKVYSVWYTILTGSLVFCHVTILCSCHCSPLSRSKGLDDELQFDLVQPGLHCRGDALASRIVGRELVIK